jgi:hypothetical protein
MGCNEFQQDELQPRFPPIRDWNSSYCFISSLKTKIKKITQKQKQKLSKIMKWLDETSLIK